MSYESTMSVRHPAIAGAWYPGSAPALRRMIEAYLDYVQPVDLPGRVLALVAPHAGYAYSGPTAAHAFALLRRAKAGGKVQPGNGSPAPYARVILLGPLHRLIAGSRLGSFMVPREQSYRTPLGDVPVDRSFIEALGARVTLTPVSGDEEHSLEIELPFLQVVLGAFRLVPIMLGEHIGDRGAPERLDRLSAALADLHEAGTLMVASTDLSHLDDHRDVVRLDRRLADLVAAFDVDGLSDALQRGQVQACGGSGLVVTLRTAQRLGAKGARVLALTNSGEVTGTTQPGAYCVGYMAAVVHG